MARNRGSRRRRRGRFAFLFKLLSFFIIVGAIVAALTLFFKMEHIAVTGNQRYTEQEVLDASGLHTGDNLYLMNKYAVKEAIFSSLPYVENVSINRKLPDTLLIEIRESRPAAALQSEQSIWLVSQEGKLLEETGVAPENCPRVLGVTLEDPAAGAQAVFPEEEAYRVQVLFTLLSAAEERGMIEQIAQIDLSDETALHFDYLGRFTVQVPWTSDIGYKLTSLKRTVESLEDNQTGRIDLMTDGKSRFIPN